MLIDYLPVQGKIQRDCELSVEEDVLTASFGEGYTQTAANGLNSQRDVWEITWNALTLDEKIEVEYKLRLIGGAGIVLWTPFYEIDEKRFKLVSRPLFKRHNNNSNNSFSISCTLRQCFDILPDSPP